MNAERSYAVFNDADVILRARIIKYEIVNTGKSPVGVDIQRARFTLDVYDNVTGVGMKKKIWKAWWSNSTFALPMEWPKPTNVIVGIKAVLQQNGEAELEIVQQGCGPYSILGDSREEINKVLDGTGMSGRFRDKYR